VIANGDGFRLDVLATVEHASFGQRQRYLSSVMRRVKEGVRKQPHSGNRAKEWSINRSPPVLLRAVFDEVLQRLVSPLDQLSAVADIIEPAVVYLTDRRVLHVRWRAEKLTEEVHRFTNMTVDEADRRRPIGQPRRGIFFGNPVEGKVAGELILLHHF